MQTKYFERIKKLPVFAQEALGGEVYEANDKIQKNYNLDDESMLILSDIKAEIILKDVRLEKISERIQEDLKVDKKTADGITLIILCEILYPVKDYFPGIEDAIKSLGGEVPKIIPKKQVHKLVDEEKTEERQTIKEQIDAEAKREKVVQADIKSLLKEYPPAGEQAIGQNSIEVPSIALPVKPKIKYWIECYKEATGYGWNTNMERVKFIYHNKNTRGMNEEERRQLGLVLKSLDEGTPLAYLVKGKRIDFVDPLK